jgi:pentatricopeptide repeat protein
MEEYSITPPKKILKLLMDTYADSRMPKEALGVLDLMRKRGMFVDAHAYSVCVKSCIGSRDNIDMLDALVKDIMGGVEKVPHRLWTTILMAYASTGNVSKVISITDDMKTNGIQLNAKDCTAMLRSCREADDIERGRDMLRHVEHQEYKEEVSLATEMIRLYDMCGDIERVIEVFDILVESGTSLDKGIFNIAIDIFMNHWSEAADPEEKQFYKNQAKRAFDIAWSQGIFGRSKPSEKGHTLHVDLHRSGLWASQLILMKSIDEEIRRGLSGKRIRAIKYITGKGHSTRTARKASLADIIRIFLYRSDIDHQEDSLGVFNVPKRSIQKIFKSGEKFSLVDPRMCS